MFLIIINWSSFLKHTIRRFNLLQIYSYLVSCLLFIVLAIALRSLSLSINNLDPAIVNRWHSEFINNFFGNFKNQIINFRQTTVFQGFSKAKSANGGSILSSSQFLILPQLPQKIKLASKVVKVDSKIIISLPKI